MKEPIQPKTMLKKEEWGGLTFLTLLAAYAFPPYFIYLMTMAALTEFAHFWTTRLSRVDQERFIEFEKEFRKGYKLEKAGQVKEALQWYRSLEKKYEDLPQAGKLATLQIRNLAQNKTASIPSAKKQKASSKSKPKRT